MVESQADDKFAQVVHKIDPHGKPLRAWKLAGGVSAQVTAIEIERSKGHTQKLIVRQYGEADLNHRPQIAADEFKLLQLLHAEGLAVPEPYLFDQSGEIFPTPYVVIEYVEGATEFAPADADDFLHQFTAQLARIHTRDCARLDVSFLPQQSQRFAERLRDRPASGDDSLDEGHIRDVLEAAWPIPQRNPPALLHGDYWPGNVLWRDGQLVAVIDWEDAAIGDPLFDVANSRLELLWAFGDDTMRQFTERYQTMTTLDCTDLPYWDLCAALRAMKFPLWAGDAEQIMRERYRWFVAQAFAHLSEQ
jgi:aminoglycoside phosphotransferase (APT) family kinase protein